jgi:hypothetical protein
MLQFIKISISLESFGYVEMHIDASIANLGIFGKLWVSRGASA